MQKDGHGKAITVAQILAATSIGIISAAAAVHHRRQKAKKEISKDQVIVPVLRRNESSGRVGKLERFSDYVARQIGFEDANECPHLCKLAIEYLKKSKSCEVSLYEYFANETNADELYVKLVEEFDRCILGYFAFHWSQASLMISQVYNFPKENAGVNLSH